MKKTQILVEKLTKNNKTISTMESCTGGGLVNEITNIEGASEVIKYSAVTYSNEYKIKMGVDKSIIDKYTVYSEETAKSMAKEISKYTKSNYGVGITGKINKKDNNNPYKEDDIVYISIYDNDENKYYNTTVKTIKNTRKENKELIIKNAVELLLKII